MQIIGEVVAILNSTYVLVRSEERFLHPGEKYQILAIVARDKLGGLDLERIYLPKGEIRIVAEQPEQIYLAERFRAGERIETRPHNLGSQFQDLFTKEVRIPGEWSAAIDEESTLKIEIDKNIRVGDAVGLL